MPPSPQNENEKQPRRFRPGSFATMLAVSVVIAAAGGLAWQLAPERHSIYTDAGSIRLPAEKVTPRDILWDAPRDVPAILIQPGDYAPATSADGRTFYFVRGEPGANADIWSTMHSPAGWSRPAPLMKVNSPFDEMGPSPSADGAAIYFSSDRPGGRGGYDLWVARRDSETESFGEPVNLGPIINTRDHETAPSIGPDGDTLYFASNRESSSPVENLDLIDGGIQSAGPRDFDIFVARDINASTAIVDSFDAANSPSHDTAPSVSPAGDFLYFASNRRGGRGGLDIYRIRLKGDANTAERLDDTINTVADQTDPALAMMGYDLYFRTFDQPGGRESRIVLSHSREVFRATAIEQASVDWNAIGAVIILALSAILLLLMARAMVDTALRRRLSLMAKCMLASLALHLMLAFVLSLWHVTATLAGWSPQSDAQRIALSPTTGGATLTEQVRGGFGESPPAQTTPRTIAAPQSLAFTPPTPTTVREPSPPGQSRSPSFQTPRTVSQPPIDTASSMATAPRTHTVAPRSPLAESRPAATRVTTPTTSPRPAQNEPARQIAKPVATTTPLAPAPALSNAASDSPIPEPTVPSSGVALRSTDSVAPDIAANIVAAVTPTFETRTAIASRAPLLAPTATASKTPVSIPTTRRRENPGDRAAETVSTDSVANAASFAKPAGPIARPAPIDGSTLAIATASNRRIEPGLNADAAKLADVSNATTIRLPAPTFDTGLPSGPAPPDVASTDRVKRMPAISDTPVLDDSLALPGSTDSVTDEPLGPGWITGRVIDAETRRPIADAFVELDRADDESIIAATGGDGRYAFKTSNVPEHFALTASADDYLPASINIASSDVEQRVLWVDFELPPQTPDTVAIETTPNVHHLGDNRFTGVINSRFQKRAEGGRYTATFALAANQLPPHYRQCELTLLARGVQMAHPIYINGRRLEQALDRSPGDGRFGNLSIEIPIELLHEGENTIHIRARKRGHDRDDFEFVNLQFHLTH